MKETNDQKIYEKFMEEYEDFMMVDECFETFYAYGPLSNNYWSYKPRILVCNLEPYDEREDKVVVDIGLFKEWMNVNTGKFTAKFISGLIKSLNENKLNEPIDFKKFFHQELLSYMENIAYLNFRISSGKNVTANNKRILEEVQAYKPYLTGQINLLSPDIIIIGGIQGCRAFNILFDSNFKFNTTSLFGEKIICSINHFSRANYKNYTEKIIEISNFFQLIK